MIPIADDPLTNPKRERGVDTSPKRERGSATTTASQPKPIGALAEIAEPSGTNESRIMLALQEYRTAREAGANPDRQEFLTRHADIAAELAQCLEALDFVYEAAPKFQESALEPAGLLQTSDISKTSDVSAEGQPPLPLGDYQIIREIGRGGMGVVYEAIQMSLSRRVALKVLPFASTLDAKQLQRFKNEAQAAAGLHHTNIVPVFATGIERGVHYYAMQYIEGQTLAALIRELRMEAGLENREATGDPGRVSEDRESNGEPGCVSARSAIEDRQAATDNYDPAAAPGAAPANSTLEARGPATDTAITQPRSSIFYLRSWSVFRTVAQLGIQAAEALEYAHQMGIIHRDIKPGNLLVETPPLTTDHSSLITHHSSLRLWITDFGLAHCQSQAGLTMTGDLVGTLRYMSPEQALAKRVVVDHRTDIYSLGATLYELLTLEPVFSGRDRQELLRQIAFEDPKPPRRLNKAIPPELETIVLKAVEKNPADRYATAQELADDLQRYLDDKAIRAKRPTPVQRFRKLARRHPGVARMAVGLLAVVTLGSILSNVLITWQKNQKDRALVEKGDALADAQANFDEADKQKKLAQANSIEAQKHSQLAVERQRIAEREGLTARRRFYAAQMNLAHQAWEAGQSAHVLVLLEGQRPKFGQLDLRTFEWYYLWRLCHTGCRTLRGHTGTVKCVAFSPNGRTLASGNENLVKLWDVATGEERATLKHGGDGWMGVAFSPDGKTLASVNDSGPMINLWDVATGEKQATLQGRDSGRTVAFSPDGKTLATGSEAGSVTLWDVASRQQRAFLQRAHTTRVLCVAFSRDGKTLASASHVGEQDTKLWDLTAEPVRGRLRLPNGIGVAFSPDGETVAAGGNDLIKLYDLRTGKERAGFQGPTGLAFYLAFAGDGKLVASANGGTTVSLCDVATGQVARRLGHFAPVDCVAASLDGQTVATGAEDGAVRLWDVKRLPDQTTLQHPGRLFFVVFSPDGKRLISGGNQPMVWDVAFEQAAKNLAMERLHLPVSTERLVISPDCELLASWDGAAVKLWDLATGQTQAIVPVESGLGLHALAFSQDSKTLAIASTNGLKLWDVATQRVRPVDAAGVNPWVIAFSPDGKYFAAAVGPLKLWDAASEQPKATFEKTEWGWRSGISAVSFSPDSKIVASGYSQGTVRLWGVDSGQLRAPLKGHTDEISSLAFFPDGMTLATGSQDKTITLWDVATGQERVSLKGHKEPVVSLAVAPDGLTLATASGDGTVKLWRAANDPEATALKPDLDPDDPDSPVAQNNLGDRLEATGRAKEAEAAYRQARARLEKLVPAFPKVPAYRRELARSHINLARLNGQEIDLEKARALINDLESEFIPNQWQLLDSYKDLGALLMARRRKREADEAYAKALKQFPVPDDARALNGQAWGRVASPNCRIADALLSVALAERAVELLPNAGIWNTLGVAHYRAGNWKEAVAPLEKSMELRGPNATDLFFLAMADWQLGSKERAKKWYAAGIAWMNKYAPKNGDPFQAEAAALLKLPNEPPPSKDNSRNDEVEIWSQILEADPTFACGLGWSARGQAFAGSKTWDKADVDFAKAIQLQPDQTATWYCRALARLGSGDLSGYRSQCAAMVKQFATTEKPDGANWVAWTCALAPDAVKDLDQPVKLAERAFQGNPKHDTYSVTLGAALYRAGRFAEAITQLEKASPAYACFFLAMAHQRLGHAEEARKSLDKGINWMDQETQNKNLSWNRRLTLQLLRLEAEALVKGSVADQEKAKETEKPRAKAPSP